MFLAGAETSSAELQGWPMLVSRNSIAMMVSANALGDLSDDQGAGLQQ